MEINICVKRVIFNLIPYNKSRDEWDLYVDGERVCDNKPYSECLFKFLEMIGD